MVCVEELSVELWLYKRTPNRCTSMVGVRMNIALWNLNFVNKYSDGLGRSTKPALTPSPSRAVESFSLLCRKRAIASVTDTFTNVSPTAAIIIIIASYWIEKHGIEVCKDDRLVMVISQQYNNVCQSSCWPVRAATFWQHCIMHRPMLNLLYYNWSCCWNSFSQSNEGEKEHIIYPVFATSLSIVSQLIPYHVFQLSVANLKMLFSKGFGMYCMLVVGLGWEGLCTTSTYWCKLHNCHAYRMWNIVCLTWENV